MISNYPLVSVVTATYTHFEKLYNTIDSVFSQTYSEIEYLITDDGSTNFPKEEVELYIKTHCPSNIKCIVIHHEQNVGTVKNLNGAYRRSNGKYILNLSCGDVFFEDITIDLIVCKFRDLDCDVLVTSRLLYKNNFEPICFLPHYSEREIILKKNTGLEQYKAFITSKFYDMASGSAMYFSRKIIKKIGYFDENYLLWEDGPFLAKYLLIGKLSFAYDIVSIWYETGGISSISVDMAPKKMQKDMETFILREKMCHIELLSPHEKRLVIYRNKRFLKRNSIIKYPLYFLYFPELISFLRYSRDRKKRIQEDGSFIKELLEKKSSYEEKNQS